LPDRALGASFDISSEEKDCWPARSEQSPRAGEHVFLRQSGPANAVTIRAGVLPKRMRRVGFCVPECTADRDVRVRRWFQKGLGDGAGTEHSRAHACPNAIEEMARRIWWRWD
jgi:hypothetical protein